MQLDTRTDAAAFDAHTPVLEPQSPDALAAEAIEWEEAMELATPRAAPARGIFNALVIGAGSWTLIFAAIALGRAILSG
jgi:hypothetical protein